jgi:hypothetical protein
MDVSHKSLKYLANQTHSAFEQYKHQPHLKITLKSIEIVKFAFGHYVLKNHARNSSIYAAKAKKP